MFGNWKLIAGAIFLLVLAGTYIAFLRSEQHVAKLQNEQVAAALANQTAILNQQSQDISLMRAVNDQIQADFQRTAENVQRLGRRFNTQAIHEAGSSNPSALQASANQDALWTVRCNELQTGAALTPADAGNQICPELVGSH